MGNSFQAMDKIFVLDKKYFVQADGQGIRQKIFCPGQNYFVEDKSDFVPDINLFVQADGKGISSTLKFL